MTDNNRNMILAVVLSMFVLFGWQFFVAGPQLERAALDAEMAQQQQAEQESADRLPPRPTPRPSPIATRPWLPAPAF
jgi:YidC/Oxa1 family membrane protein insertase